MAMRVLLERILERGRQRPAGGFFAAINKPAAGTRLRRRARHQGGLGVLVVLETDPAVDDDLGTAGAELREVDRRGLEGVRHRRAAGVKEREIDARGVDAVGVLQRAGAERVRRAVGREAPLELALHRAHASAHSRFATLARQCDE